MNTQLKQLIDKADFQQILEKKGYTYFTDGDYNLNLIGIRNLLNGYVQDDTFNDAYIILYKVNGVWHKEVFECTTDPGLKILRTPSNPNGTAILVPGQYKRTWRIDLHNGKYKALCQRAGLVKVYRDRNRDNVLDMNPATIQEGYFGINMHMAGLKSEIIGGYSAGCQVFHHRNDFYRMMELAEKASSLYGNLFTYTLLTTDDLK